MTLLEEPTLLEEAPAVENSSLTCETCGKNFRSTGGLGAHRHFAHSTRQRKAPAKAVKPDKVIPPPTKRESKPTVHATPVRRKPCDAILGGIWAAVSVGVVAGISPTAAQIMTWQAEAAGPVLDDWAAGTFLDKLILQKIAGKGEKAKSLGALIGLPATVIIIQRQPALAGEPLVRQLLRGAVKTNFEAIMDAQIKEKAKIARWEAKAEQAGMDLYVKGENGEYLTDERGQKIDVVDALVNDILASLVPPAAVPTE